jgi:hypothetical protein
MGYAVGDNFVRASRFKPSGKWYDDVALDMAGEFNTDSIQTAIKNAYTKTYHPLHPGWMLVVLEPYHKHSHPIIIKGE